MPQLTIDVLQLLEEKLGKEEAKKVAEAIELALESIEEKAKGMGGSVRWAWWCNGGGV